MKKIITLSITGAVLIVPIIAFSIPWSNIQTINAAGSSAVQPLLAKISNVYTKADLVTQAGGSGAGIKLIANSQKDIGMASKNPKIVGPGSESADPAVKKNWKKKRIKTVTIAWDGLGIIYKPKNANDKILDINQNNIGKIYQAFAGFKQLRFSDLDPKWNSDSDINILAFARSGGSAVSGTADAFFKDSGFKNYDSNLSEDEKNALKNGSYGPYTTPTNESNSQAFSFIKDLGPGIMTYLSAGYILNNEKQIEDAGFKIATYNGIKISDNKISEKGGYEWFRPLNLMVSLASLENKSKDLINAIFTDTKIRKIIKDEGYINLSKNQIESMGTKKDFWNKSDSDLNFCGANPESSK